MLIKKVTPIILIIVFFLLIIQLIFSNGNAQSKNLEDLNIQQLTEIRDNNIDKNLESLRSLGKNSIQNRKNEILNSDFGLIAFVNTNYKNLTEKDKLIKQIKIIEYLNSINEIMDSSGDFFKIANEDYQLSEYLLKNGKNSDISSYENLKFLINNLEDLSNFIDYDIKNMLENIDALIQLSLSQDEKSSLKNDLQKITSEDNVNIEIKNKIKDLQSYTND